MIGFQQQQQQQGATGRSNMTPARDSNQRAHLPQLSQHCQQHQMTGPMIKVEPQQHASSPSPSPTSQQTPVSQTHLNDFKSHQRKSASSSSSASSRRASSPGYHSAASSPGSSISSPVSSSASTASSSGVSSTASERGGLHVNSGQCQLVSPTCSLSSSSSSTSALMTTMSCSGTTTGSPNATKNQNTANVLVPASSPLHSAATTANTITTPTSSSFSSSSSSPPQHIQDLASPNNLTNYNHQQQASAHLQRQPTNSNQNPNQNQNQNQNQNSLNQCNLPNLLDYFPETHQDGLNLSWFHAANNRQTLGEALASNKLIVSGDISLAEMSRYPVPIMARPPLGVSDLTLENWLSDVIRARKGIKLTFTSTRTVEPAFRVLARHAEHLKGPIILSADILARPQFGQQKQQANNAQQAKQQQQQQQPVDAWTFLMLCRTRFPKSIISIGWCAAQGGSQAEFSMQPADSSTSGESMFELDMVLDQQQQQQQQPQQPQQPQQHHFSQPLLHLSTVAPPSSHQRTSLNSLSVVQQLAAVAAAAAANNQQHPSAHPSLNLGHHHHHHHHHQQHHHHNHQPHQQHRLSANPNPQRHHYILSSNGSLNSSSGNSSGSPSPTSPIGHLMSPAQQAQLQRHHLSLAQHQQHPTSTEQLILAVAAAADAKSSSSPAKAQNGAGNQAVGWPAVAAAAMVAASSFKQQQQQRLHQHDGPEREQREDEAEEEDEEDEEEEEEEDADADADEDEPLPLNLNINEADPQHSTLSELAQKIHSLQQQSSNLNSLTSSLSVGHHHQQHQSAAALALASKLLAGSSSSTRTPPLPPASGDHQKWEHISKKAAVANRLNSNSPSPVSTSPKQQHAQGGNLLSCVKTSSLGGSGGGQAYHQQLPSVRSTMGQAHQQHQPLAYTREMIDKMASLVKEYNLTQPITFAVEARGLLGARNANSLAELQRLLYQVGSNSSLTLVAQQEDLISVDELLALRKQFASNQILFDLPDELASQLRHELEPQL